MVHLIVHAMVPILFYLPFLVSARPSRTIPYFPHYKPWDMADLGIHAEETRWNPYGIFEELSPQNNKNFYTFDSGDKQFRDRSSIQSDLQLSLPVYEKGRGGFVPPSMSTLDKVYWWEKRFNNFDLPPSEDLPYFDDQDDYEIKKAGSIKKRDYTAAQLVNMLKALAKARRQRQIRIAGKGLRFGISR